MLYLIITVCHSEVLTLSSVSLTWTIGLGSLGVQGFRSQWGTRLEFGFGKLRQVGHHWVLIHVRIHNLLWSNHLDGQSETFEFRSHMLQSGWSLNSILIPGCHSSNISQSSVVFIKNTWYNSLFQWLREHWPVMAASDLKCALLYPSRTGLRWRSTSQWLYLTFSLSTVTARITRQI